MPDAKAVFIAAVDTLESAPFRYIIYGGVAAGIIGEPRYTEDVDIVLFLHERELPKFLRAAAAHGFAVDEDLAIQQYQVNGWARLPLGDRGSGWHLDVTLGDSPFDRSALARRVRAELFGRSIFIPTPEDLIIYKLVSARDRDLIDVQGVAKRQILDAAYLRQWADHWERDGVEKIRERVEALLKSTARG